MDKHDFEKMDEQVNTEKSQTPVSKPVVGGGNASEVTVKETVFAKKHDKFVEKHSYGWHRISKEDISYGGALYPKDWEFEIKVMDVLALREFSAIQDNDPISILHGFANLIESNVRIVTRERGSTKYLSGLSIYEHDRMLFVLLIHAYSNISRDITYEHTCDNPKCNHENEIKLTPFNVRFSELSETAKQYLKTDGKFVIRTEQYGETPLFLPTVSDAMDVNTWSIKRLKDGRQVNMTFYEVLPYIMSDYDRFPEIKEHDYMDSMYVHFVSENVDAARYSFYLNLAREYFNIKWENKLDYTCEKCNRGGIAPVRFPNRPSTIFLTKHNNIKFC